LEIQGDSGAANGNYEACPKCAPKQINSKQEEEKSSGKNEQPPAPPELPEVSPRSGGNPRRNKTTNDREKH